MAHHLTKLDLPTAIAESSEAYIATLYSLSPTSALRIGVLESYVQGFKAIFLVMTCVSGTALLASSCIGRFSMDRLLESDFKLDGFGREKERDEGV
jgi:hypothetical protein